MKPGTTLLSASEAQVDRARYSARALRIIEESREVNWFASRYMDFHKRRFEHVTQLCESMCSPGSNPRVLDIGRSELSRMLGSKYRRVETLGFAIERDAGGHCPASPLDNQHHTFDLNLAGQVEEWPDIGSFDLIVMAEVLEHLYVAPELILTMLNSLLSEKGFLVVQTPNAAAVHKRLKLLVGQNPYELIRPWCDDPGHFREYTKAELLQFGQAAGLKTVFHEYADYFGCVGNRTKHWMNAVYNCTFSFVPSLRRGQTVVYQPDPSRA